MDTTSSHALYIPEGNAFVGTEGIYHLPHHQRELERLQMQHHFMLSATEGLLLTTPVEPNSHLRVLDAGAADGTWLRSLAELYPDQKGSLHGVDLGAALFPPPSADGPILHLQKMDIREPAPEHLQWGESFDIIHQRLLIWGLKSHEWPQSLTNLLSLLRPGGWLQLVECQWVDRDEPVDPIKSPKLAKMSEMQKWSTAAFGMNIYIAYELKKLLQDLGFQNITKTSLTLGYGSKAREEHWKVPSAHMWVSGFRSLGHKMPPEGIPGVAKTPAEFDAFLNDLRDEVLEHGYAPRLNIITGQKPQI
ncbi:class I SAM-dependent methyltransferase [Aspergillus ibericus CBS 121593]|uniref:Methyltransferase n=1 Tax=Aspergillus ibericus CBS 121593 TaxID=1448316 RepID=A0A395HE13_9EURO|nr:methyltransferase [Aspergillus ibericus CBS 121593]RAL06092.1 methyltransferase [Aspergillus ibericus CBS 121593]